MLRGSVSSPCPANIYVCVYNACVRYQCHVSKQLWIFTYSEKSRGSLKYCPWYIFEWFASVYTSIKSQKWNSFLYCKPQHGMQRAQKCAIDKILTCRSYQAILADKSTMPKIEYQWTVFKSWATPKRNQLLWANSLHDKLVSYTLYMTF